MRVKHDEKYWCDPLRPDTDLDGVTDGREVVLGINPNRRTPAASSTTTTTA